MRQIILLQCGTTLVVAIIAGLLGGMSAWWSSLLGGVCCVLPNALFAWRLYRVTLLPSGSSPMTFFFGEMLKIVMTLVLFGAVVVLYRDVNWLALVVTFIAVLKSYLILLFRNRL